MEWLGCRLSHVLSFDQSRFLKAVVSIPGDDDVVKDTDAENCGGLGKLFVNLEVGVAGVQVAGRVIVGENDCGGAIDDYVGKHFARAAVLRHVFDGFHVRNIFHFAGVVGLNVRYHRCAASKDQSGHNVRSDVQIGAPHGSCSAYRAKMARILARFRFVG